ncbi:ABC transporter ATP-binding protein [Metallumcola ferriviriculae]|uniref:ABC transporter ATP-binding protein n=1 Tax=Metallumcola ferriviriculae TaxID=3039180 RepID=A0AAU0UMK1_9FIRM|nr:ABC transporter ATP-binding protein [Desulfitibacteraceae bacterium MK1]
MTLLKIENLHINYGHVHALKGVSLEVGEGEIVTLLGANGAGKTTTLRAISGLLKAVKGDVLFNGDSLKTVKAHDRVELGISQSPEGRRVFSTLTVHENLSLGAYSRRKKDWNVVEKTRRFVYDLFPRLEERKNQTAGTLSGGEQQMLAIGRALMAKPKLMLLDEPSLGLAPLLVQNIFKTIREINKQGVTILLVEQNARAALKVASRGYVLETGNCVLSGSADDLLADEAVRKAYLGEK